MNHLSRLVNIFENGEISRFILEDQNSFFCQLVVGEYERLFELQQEQQPRFSLHQSMNDNILSQSTPIHKVSS